MSTDELSNGSGNGSSPVDGGAPSDHDERVATFLRSPEAYVHDSWFDVIEHGALLRRLRDVERTRAHVSEELLAHHGLDLAPFAELDDPPVATLCLADPAELRDLVWHIGLVAGSRQLRHTLDGAEVRRVRESLGEPSYLFAINRAEFIAAESELARLPAMDTNELPWAVSRHGLRTIAALCATLPSGLNRRLEMKLPVRWARQLGSPFEPEARPAVRELIVRVARARGTA